MTILSDRWKGLRQVPHVRLARLPTPVMHLPKLSVRVRGDVWVKRDDLAGDRYAGNKVRKLEYVFGEALARGSDSVITVGAAGSHHALATARLAPEVGLVPHTVLVPQPHSPHAEEHLRALLAAGAEVHPVRSMAGALRRITSLTGRLRLSGRKPMVIGPGGSSVAGVIGHVEAGLELARQIEAGVLPEPDALFVPLGSGGTAAGLAVGLLAQGLTLKIVAVRVVPRAFATRRRLRKMIERCVAHLRSLDERFPDVAEDATRALEVDHGEYGGGYGVATGAGRNATRLVRAESPLELDPTYTAKCYAAALRRASSDLQGRRLLVVHTLSGVDLQPEIEGAPALPASLRRLLTR